MNVLLLSMFLCGLVFGGGVGARTDDHPNSVEEAIANPSAVTVLDFSISSNIKVKGTIDKLQTDKIDYDVFKMVVPGKGVYTIGTDSNLDTYLNFYTSEKKHIFSEGKGGKGKNFWVYVKLDPGEYFICIHSNSGLGPYVLQSTKVAGPADDYGDKIGEAAPIALGATVRGNLEFRGDKDVFKVVLPSKGYLAAKCTTTTPQLLVSNGTAVSPQLLQYSFVPGNYKFVTKEMGKGTYFIVVSNRFSDLSGPYSLVTCFSQNVKDDHPNSIDEAKSDPTTVVLEVSDDKQSAIFRGKIEERDKDVFEVIAKTGRLEVISNWDIRRLYLKVLSKDGKQIEMHSISGSYKRITLDDLPKSGCYFEVSYEGYNSHEYELYIKIKEDKEEIARYVRQKSVLLVTEAYRLTRSFPGNEVNGLISQIRNSALSILTNLAEGYGIEKSTSNHLNSLKAAVRSNYKFRALLEIARNLEYLPKNEYKKMFKISREIELKLIILIRK